ncbi:hypothetical protein [Streptomyces sp. NPDC051286]
MPRAKGTGAATLTMLHITVITTGADLRDGIDKGIEELEVTA